MANMQIMGLASGLDINGIIDQLIEIERQPLYKLMTNKNNLELRKETISQINMSIYDFQSDVFNFTLEGTFRGKKVDSSNEGAVSANASINAVNGTFTFRNIELATSTVVSGTAPIFTSNSFSSSESIASITTTNSWQTAGFSAPPTGSVTINGVEFNLSHYSSVDSFMNAVVNHSSADVDSFVFNSATNSFSITAASGKELVMFEKSSGTGFLTAAKIPFISKNTKFSQFAGITEGATSITSGVFSINGVDFTINKDVDTIQRVVDRINNSSAGVIAFFDDVTQKFTLTSKDQGNQSIVLEDKSSNFLSAMNVKDAPQNLGKNASFEFNGVSTTRNSNTFEINGVTYTLSEETTGPVNITVSSDHSDIADKIENFVEKYNSIMETIYTKLNEEKASNSAINSAANDEEARELMKKGLLKRDQTLRQLQDEMKNFFAISFAGFTMEDIGLKAAGAAGVVTEEMKKGLISFDREVFEAKLAENPEMVEAMFRNSGKKVLHSNEEIAIADGNKKTFALNYRNIGQEVKIKVDGVEYKLVTEPQAADEFSLNRTSGQITFFEAPANNSKIQATFTHVEGNEYYENEKTLGSGNGFRTNFRLGNKNIGQNINIIVGDGSVSYNQVERKDELSGNSYYVDRDTGTITFAEPIASDVEVKASYSYIMSQNGIFNEMYEGLKSYTGIGSFYQAENSITSEIKSITDSISSMSRRIEGRQQRLVRQYTALEMSINNVNSQGAWLSQQLNNLGSWG
ncbi:MAG: flagellar filament capping protein FliD [Candidatus Muiribacteriota bacterium]